MYTDTDTGRQTYTHIHTHLHTYIPLTHACTMHYTNTHTHPYPFTQQSIYSHYMPPHTLLWPCAKCLPLHHLKHGSTSSLIHSTLLKHHWQPLLLCWNLIVALFLLHYWPFPSVTHFLPWLLVELCIEMSYLKSQMRDFICSFLGKYSYLVIPTCQVQETLQPRIMHFQCSCAPTVCLHIEHSPPSYIYLLLPGHSPHRRPVS